MPGLVVQLVGARALACAHVPRGAASVQPGVREMGVPRLLHKHLREQERAPPVGTLPNFSALLWPTSSGVDGKDVGSVRRGVLRSSPDMDKIASVNDFITWPCCLGDSSSISERSYQSPQQSPGACKKRLYRKVNCCQSPRHSCRRQ